MKTYTIWSGRMRLSNIKQYLTEALDVPAAAIELKISWPNEGILEEATQDEMNKYTLTQLRDMWNQYK